MTHFDIQCCFGLLFCWIPFSLGCVAIECRNKIYKENGLKLNTFKGEDDYNNDTQPVDANLLSCGFGAGESCCWHNAKAKERVDRHDFYSFVASKDFYDKCTGGPSGVSRMSTFPEGGFMGLYLYQYSSWYALQGNAMFVSCPIDCPESVISLKVWKSQGSTLRVCRRDVKPAGGGALQDCQVVKYTKGGYSNETFTFVATKMHQIVIEASDYKQPFDYVGFDDIVVDTPGCSLTTASPVTTPSTNPTSLCALIPCDFKNDICHWKQPEVQLAAFKNYQAGVRVGNADSGVNYFVKSNKNAGMPLVSDSPFAAVDLPRRKKAMMQVDGLVLPYDMEMKFTAYDACRYNIIKVCFVRLQDSRCKNATEYSVRKADRQWQETGYFTVPAGTTTIVIKADNDGPLYCAAGVTKFMVRDPKTQQVC